MRVRMGMSFGSFVDVDAHEFRGRGVSALIGVSSSSVGLGFVLA